MRVSIPGWEGLYDASDDGRIWSVGRTVMRSNGCSQVIRARELAQSSNGKRLGVVLYRRGMPHRLLVHRLVALAFIPNPDRKPQINHRDGNQRNNSADNLEWVTPAENIRHAVATGLVVLGEARAGSRLTDAGVRRIRAEYKSGVSQRELAAKVGINQAQVSRVVGGKSWRHVQ